MQGTLSSSSLSSSAAKTSYARSVRFVSSPPRSTSNVEAKRTAPRVSTPVYRTASTSFSTHVFTAATALPRPPSSSTPSVSSREFRRFPVVAASALWTPATVDVLLQPPQRRHQRHAPAAAAAQPSPQRRSWQQQRPKRRSKVSASRTNAAQTSSNAAARNSAVVTDANRPVVVPMHQVRSMSQPSHHQQQQQQQLPSQQQSQNHPRHHHHHHPFHQLQRGHPDDHRGNDGLVTPVFAGSAATRFMYPRYVPAVIPPQFQQPMSNATTAYHHVSTSSSSPPPLSSHPLLGFRYSTTATNGNLGTTTWIVATSASTISKPVVSLTVADSRFRTAAAVRVLPSDATVFAVHGVVGPSSASVIPLVPGRACSSVSAGSAFRRPSEPTALVLPSGDNRNPCLVAVPQASPLLHPVPLLPSAASVATTARRRSNGRRGPYRVPTDRCYAANSVASLATRAPVRVGNDGSKSAITTVAARNNDRTTVRRLPSPPTISTPMEQQHLMFHHHYHHFYGVNGQKRLSSSSSTTRPTTTTASLMQQQAATEKRDLSVTLPCFAGQPATTTTFCRVSRPVSRATEPGTIATAATTTPRIATCVAPCREIGSGGCLAKPAITANTAKRDRVVPTATTVNAASNACSLTTTASTTNRTSSRRSPQQRRTAVAGDCGGIRTYIDGLSFRLDVRLLAVERRLNTLSSLNKRLSRLLEHPLFAYSSSPVSRFRVPSDTVLRNEISASCDTVDDGQRVCEFPLDCSLIPVTAPDDTSLSTTTSAAASPTTTATTTTTTTTTKTASTTAALPRRQRSLTMDRTSLGEVATRAADTDANNNCSSRRISDRFGDGVASDTNNEEPSSLRDVHANAVLRCEASMQTDSIVSSSLTAPSQDSRDNVACCFEANRNAGYRSCNHDDDDDDEEDDDNVVACAGHEVGYDEDDNDVEAVETLETRYFRRHAVRTAGDGVDGDDQAERLVNGQSLPP